MILPYLGEDTAIGQISSKLPLFLSDQQGHELRVLTPRFGAINERRHRLHEVVRLSGINIIINEDDFPLIIKVASMPGSRLQVYFLENEDYYKRRAVLTDDDGNFFDDNAERMIFFCRGVLETVRKFGWAPDVSHCHGWMTSLVPWYVKTFYNNVPVFSNSKVIYSVYDNEFEGTLNQESFKLKATMKGGNPADLEAFGNTSNNDLHKAAINWADAVVTATTNSQIDADLDNFIKNKKDLLFLDHYADDNYLGAYKNLYQQLFDLGEQTQ